MPASDLPRREPVLLNSVAVPGWRLLSCAPLLFLAACAGPQLPCHGTQRSAAVADLMFGHNIGHRRGVSEAAWRQFLASEVTPRFPDGLTVLHATGQWRDTDTARIVREPSKVVTVILGDRVGDEAKIDAIVEAYKRRFRQQAVGVVIRPACVAFL
jgi:hypothetical protein